MLQQKGISEDNLCLLQDIFGKCEAGGYAGIDMGGETSSLCDEMLNLVKDLERKLK